MKYLLQFLFMLSAAAGGSASANESKAGSYIYKEWQGYPVIIYKRTPEQIKQLKSKAVLSNTQHLYDAAARKAYMSGNQMGSTLFYSTLSHKDKAVRSQTDDLLVVLGLSSSFGCAIKFDEQQSVFVDPCSKSTYGLDGRILTPTNREQHDLLIPPYLIEKGEVKLGKLVEEKIIDFAPSIADLDMPDFRKLLSAISWRKTELAKRYINKKTAQETTQTGANALHAAAGNTMPDIIKLLVEAGADINKITQAGYTPLQLALLNLNDLTNAKTMIELGAKTEKYCQGKQCTQSAMEFVTYSYPELSGKEAANVKMLLDKGK